MRTALFLILIFVSLISCQEKSYYPNTSAYRDPDLVGTWRYDVSNNEDSTFIVYTAEGYTGCSYYVNNAQIEGFTGLHQIWQNIEEVGNDGWGKIYHADDFSSWVKWRSEDEAFYRISESKDTLFYCYINLKTKKANKNKPEVYIRNAFQLIFDGPTWVCIDSIKAK